MDLLIFILNSVKLSKQNLPDNAKWVALNPNGEVRLFQEEPVIEHAINGQSFWIDQYPHIVGNLYITTREQIVNQKKALRITPEISKMIRMVITDDWLINDGKNKYSQNKFQVVLRDGRFVSKLLNYQDWELNIGEYDIVLYKEFILSKDYETVSSINEPIFF